MKYPVPQPGVLRIVPYVGGDYTPLGLVRRVCLASNENPYGCSPQVLEAIREGLTNVHRYPIGPATPLREAISQHFHLPVHQIVCGNGSEELIHLLATAFTGPEDEVVCPEYGFLVYEVAALSAGATAIKAKQPHFRLEVNEVLRVVNKRTKIVFIDNPANPLSSYVSYKEIVRLHQALPPHVLLVLDGAYADFLEGDPEYQAGFELVKRFPNVVVTRTFSKLYGLAGLRVGWAYMPIAIAESLNAVRMPFNVNRLAQSAAIVALQDQPWIDSVRQKLIRSRQEMHQQIEQMGYRVLPSATNFLMVEVPPSLGKTAKDLYTFLGRTGVIVRPMGGYGLPHFLRVTIGTKGENQECVSLMRDFIKL